MKKILLSALLPSAVLASTMQIETVAEFKTRPANLAVSKNGEVYVTMHPMDGGEVKLVKITEKGDIIPFTNPLFMGKTGLMQNIGIANAIGIFITKKDILWVLDMGGQNSSPKFISWNLQKNKLEQIITIPNEVFVANSFLQDFAIDEKNNFAFIADMTEGEKGKPAIVAIDLKTGEAKRLLENSKFLVAQKPLMAEGKEVKIGNSKKGAMLGINPITIDKEGKWVYFGAMNEGEIYRILAKNLENFTLKDEELESMIENFGYKPHSDGFKIDENENIYIGDVNNLEIGINKNGSYKSYIKSTELKWVDGLFAPLKGNYVYATVNQLNRHANFNNGKEKGEGGYKIIRFKKAE